MDDLKVSSSSPFQVSMKNLVALLCSQMIDMIEEIEEFRSSLAESRENSNHDIISAEKYISIAAGILSWLLELT